MPSLGHTCNLCNRDHHMEHVCRSKDKPKIKENDTYFGSAVFDTVCSVHDSLPNINCTVSNSGFERSICIHGVKQHSKPQPFLNVTATVTTEDYAALGFHLERDTKTALLPAMADTGCQSCLAGLKVLHQLGLRESDLLPVTIKMHTATYRGITILGATVLRFNLQR